MENNLRSKIVGAGIPTKIDVDILVQVFGVPKKGTIIEHKEVEETIKVSRDSHRYGTVVSAWRRRLENEHNIILKGVAGKGYECLTESGRVGHSASVYKYALKRVSRSVEIAAKTERKNLNADEKRTVDHIQKTGAALRLAAQQEARKIKWDDDESGSEE